MPLSTQQHPRIQQEYKRKRASPDPQEGQSVHGPFERSHALIHPGHPQKPSSVSRVKEKKEKKERKTSPRCHRREICIASYSSWSKAICNLKRVWGAPTTTTSFWRRTPWTGVDKPTCTYLHQGQAPTFPHAWLKISSSHEYPHHGRVCIANQVLRKVTRLSTIPSLRRLDLGVSRESGLSHTYSSVSTMQFYSNM
jgi:hypothetical protein